MKRIGFLLGLLLIFSVCITSWARADAQARLRIIGASNSGAAIDPALRDVHNQLGSLFSFTSYRLLRDEVFNLSLNRPITIPVHPGRSIAVELVGQKRNLAEFRVRVIREGADILNTVVRLGPGRTVLIGGPKHGEGVVILALSAHF